MSTPKLLSKIDITVLIGLITGLLYLWGWVYWANYYHNLGLPYSVGNIGFERLLLGGSWFLWDFALHAAVYVLAGVALLYIVHWLTKNCLARLSPSWMNKDINIKLYTCLRLKWVLYPLATMLICFAYTASIDYIRNDAAIGSKKRLHEPFTKVTIHLKGKDIALLSGNYDLLEMRDNNYYFLLRQKGKTPEVVVVPESEIEYIAIQLCNDKDEQIVN